MHSDVKAFLYAEDLRDFLTKILLSGYPLNQGLFRCLRIWNEPRMYLLKQESIVSYDCHADTLQVLTTIKYSENMAAGMVLSNDATPGPLNPIAPGTVGAKKMDHICRLARQLG